MMKDKDQQLIWETYVNEALDPGEERHGIPAPKNIDADRRAAELRGPDPNEPKHGQSDANASDYDPDDPHQKRMRKAVQDLEDLPTNKTWQWTDDGGAMNWLVKRLDFINSSEWDGTDSSMPEELQMWHDKNVSEVKSWLQDRILEALYRSSDTPKVYANPEGANWNPTDLGKAAVKGIFDNGDSIRRFNNHWRDKRIEASKKEPSTDAVLGISPDKPEGFRLD